jgi:hypothetical protein
MAKKRTKGTKSKKRSSIWVKLGRKGGKARAARLSAVERHRIAMMGVEARRAKRSGKNTPTEPAS